MSKDFYFFNLKMFYEHTIVFVWVNGDIVVYCVQIV